MKQNDTTSGLSPFLTSIGCGGLLGIIIGALLFLLFILIGSLC